MMSSRIAAERAPTAEAASLFTRASASILDRGVEVAALGASCVVGPLTAALLDSIAVEPGAAWVAGASPLLAAAAWQSWRLGTSGQTYGRAVCGIRVVHERGEPAPPRILIAGALLRTAARTVAFAGATWILLHILPYHPDDVVIDYAAAEATARDARTVGWLLLLAGIASMLLDVLGHRDGQAFHDRLIRTRVVRVPISPR